MRMKRHGCISPTLGAACAACSRRARTSSGTAAAGVNLRMSRRSAMTRYTARRSSALNWCSLTRPAYFRGMRNDVLVTATELAQLIDSGRPVSILDVRWQLAQPDGRSAYEAGHVPGAVYVSLEDDLADHAVSGRGRHPLPSGSAVEAAARRWGIGPETAVVVYDDWNRAGSARAWWVLRAAGLADVRILDGGLAGVDRDGRCARERPGHAGAGCGRGDPRRSVRGCATDSGRRPRGGTRRPPRRCAVPGAVPRRRRTRRPGGGPHPGARNVPSTSLLDATGRSAEMRTLRRPSVTPTGRTADLGSPPRWRWLPLPCSGWTLRCSPGRGRNGVPNPAARWSRAADLGPAEGCEGCRAQKYREIPDSPGASNGRSSSRTTSEGATARGAVGGRLEAHRRCGGTCSGLGHLLGRDGPYGRRGRRPNV